MPSKQIQGALRMREPAQEVVGKSSRDPFKVLCHAFTNEWETHKLKMNEKSLSGWMRNPSDKLELKQFNEIRLTEIIYLMHASLYSSRCQPFKLFSCLYEKTACWNFYWNSPPISKPNKQARKLRFAMNGLHISTSQNTSKTNWRPMFLENKA